MKTRSLFYTAIALAGVTLMPAPARAGTLTNCFFSQQLGIGGFLTGCLAGTATQIGEDAGFISNMYYFAGGMPATSNGTYLNEPTNPLAATFMFNDQCGSSGNGTFGFCANNPGGALTSPFNNVLSGNELVFGLRVPDTFYGTSGYFDYTGAASRNGTPPPIGFQAVLMAVTVGGVVQKGDYVLAWEDKNSGCGGAIPNITTIEASKLTPSVSNGQFLDTRLENCDPIAAGGNSDSDFNDFYVRLTITEGNLLENPVPEPMTMSLMALGLVAMGGASLRRRKNK